MGHREAQLLVVAAEAQDRITEAFDRMTDAEIEGTGFDQAGLRDGLHTVDELIRAGELGVAFEHVVYMVDAMAIRLSLASSRFLEATAAALGLAPSRQQTQ